MSVFNIFNKNKKRKRVLVGIYQPIGSVDEKNPPKGGSGLKSK